MLLKMQEGIIIEILRRNNNRGLSITDLVGISNLSRSIVRTTLAKLEGAEKVEFRRIGMAKVYSLRTKDAKGIK